MNKTELKAIEAHNSGMLSVEEGDSQEEVLLLVAHFWWPFRTNLIPLAAAPYEVSFVSA